MQHRAPTEQGGPDMPFGLALGFFLGPRAQDVSLTPGFMSCAAASVPQSLRDLGVEG